jgi:5-methylcytosine-specific restriction endonuclease McrA
VRTTTPALYIYGDREVCRQTPDGVMLYVCRRFIAWTGQHERCALCHRRIPFRQATTDHIEPRRMGGGFRNDAQQAIQVACYQCNGERGSRRI